MTITDEKKTWTYRIGDIATTLFYIDINIWHSHQDRESGKIYDWQAVFSTAKTPLASYEGSAHSFDEAENQARSAVREMGDSMAKIGKNTARAFGGGA